MSAVGLFALGVGLAGCGQKGELYLPTEPAAANRATLPSLLRPSFGDARTGGTGAAAGTAPAPALPASSAAGAITSPVAPIALPEASPLTTPIIDDSGMLK